MEEIHDESIFCVFCGSNVKLLAMTASEDQETQNIQQTILDKYKDLTQQIRDLKDMDIILQEHKSHLDEIAIEVTEAKKRVSLAQTRLKKESRDVEVMNGIT